MQSNLGDTFSPRRRLAVIITLGMLTGLGPFTIDLYLPAFPVLKAELLLSDAQVQATLSATTIGFAVGQLLVGPMSDRLGRKRPLVAMTTLHVLASIMVANASGLGFLTAMRFLQGFGAAGGAVVAMAMARDLFSGRGLVLMLSRLALVTGLAPIVAPLVGSWMVQFLNWRGVFWALAVYGATVIVLVWRHVVETRPPRERTTGGFGELRAAYRRVLRDRLFVGVMLTAAAAFGGLFSYVSTSSVLFQELYGLSATSFGTIFAICSFGVFVGVQGGSRIGYRVGPQWVLVMATALMVVAATALMIIGITTTLGYWALVPAIFTYTMGFGACMPNSQVLALNNHRSDSGTAASMLGALNMLSAAAVGPLIGLVPLTSVVPMATSMLVCASLAVAALWLVARPRSIAIDLA